MVKWETDFSRVSSTVTRTQQNDISVDVLLSRGEKKQISVNTIRQHRLADLIGQVNVVLIEPHNEEIVRGDPSRRRKFMNLEISQIQPQYCHLLANYRKILDQRNKLLKDISYRVGSTGVLDVLNEQLIAYGAQILERRLIFIEKIGKVASPIHSQITDSSEQLGINYVSVIDVSDHSAAALTDQFRIRLNAVRDEEIRRGVTLVGPQRDDLTFTLNGIDARTYGSQGQQRTIALSLLLAELEVMEEIASEPPIVLLDDVMTDLDEERRTHIFEMTRGRCQTFLTAASERAFDPDMFTSARVFRVSDGRVEG